tara:strand:- start:101 stop:511 length:411 start_codon:yes stop_codon:yes gene_type:complete
MSDHYAKRRDDRIVAGPAIYSDDNYIMQVDYHETSKYKINKAKPNLRVLAKLEGTFSTSDGREVKHRIKNSRITRISKRKTNRASVKTELVNGVTVTITRHKAQVNTAQNWTSKMSTLDRARKLQIMEQNKRLADQ